MSLFKEKSHKRLHFAPPHIFSRKNLLLIKCIQRGYQKKAHNSVHGDEHKIPPLSTSVTTTPDTDQTLSSVPSSHLWAFFAIRTKYHKFLSPQKNSTTALASHQGCRSILMKIVPLNIDYSQTKLYS